MSSIPMPPMDSPQTAQGRVAARRRGGTARPAALLALWSMLAVGGAPRFSAAATTPPPNEKQKAQTKARLQDSTPSAQAPQPVINYIYPAGGQQGKTFTATVGGTNLANPSSFITPNLIRITGGGVTARLLQATNPNVARISIRIAPEAQPGEREVRFVTRAGASNRARFVVGTLAEISEDEPNSTKDQAQTITTLPVVVNGQIQQEDRDYFRIRATAGQTLVFALRGRVLQPYIADAVPGWMDAALTLFDAAGRKLVSVDDDWFKPDPVLIFKVPKDGDYLLEVADVIYRGRGDFVYRLSMGELPYLTDVFPLGGRRGEEAVVALHGVNLPAQTLRFAVPADSPPVRWLSVSRGGLDSNPVPFAAGDLPELLEAETNDSPAHAQRVEVPVTINGRINRPGDADCFLFGAKAGQSLVLEVRARRLDSPLDSALALFGPKGQELAANDDTVDPLEPLVTHHADSRLSYTFPTSGDYVLRIRDIQGAGGEEYAYRLSIAPGQPDFDLRVTPDNPRTGRGDCAVLTVNALRRDGFTNEIRLTAKGLPPEYVMSGALMPAGQDEIRFTIGTPADAMPGVASPEIVGEATLDGRSVTRRAQPAESVMQAFSYTHLVPTKELLLAVIDPGPFTLAPHRGSNAVLRVPQGGSASVVVKIIRNEPGQGQLTLQAAKPPLGIVAKTAPVPPDKDEGVITISATRQAVVGLRQNIIITGTLRSGRTSSTAVAPAIPIEIVAAAK